MIKNILLTGLPGCGKTTLIKEIIKEKKLKAGGFYTQEIRENNQRVGFEIVTLSGKKGILAHQNFESKFKVGKYKVNLKDLEEIAVKEIEEAIKNKDYIIIDEIGKIEMFSEKFKEIVLKALESPKKVLATIKLIDDGFTKRIKKDRETKVFYLSKENKEEIKREILLIL